MMATNVVDYAEKLFSLGLGAVGTWLTLRTFYQKRQQETQSRHQETLDRYATSQQKAYAAERDFEHLKRNQEQMKEALRMMDDELQTTREDVREIKGMLTAWFGKMGDSISGFFGHKREG